MGARASWQEADPTEDTIDVYRSEGENEYRERTITYVHRGAIAVVPGKNLWQTMEKTILCLHPDEALLVAICLRNIHDNNHFDVPRDSNRMLLRQHLGVDVFPDEDRKRKWRFPGSRLDALWFKVRTANWAGSLLAVVLAHHEVPEFQYIGGLLAPLVDVAITQNWKVKCMYPSFGPTYLDSPPDYFGDALDHLEGARYLSTAAKAERDPKLRAIALRTHGLRCRICESSFADKYGEAFEHCVHIHHLDPLNSGVRSTNPDRDLIPVCPNCHAVIHKRVPCYTPEEVRTLLEARRQQGSACESPPHRG